MDFSKSIPSFTGSPDNSKEGADLSGQPVNEAFAASIKVALGIANENDEPARRATILEGPPGDSTESDEPLAGSSNAVSSLAQIADALALITARAIGTDPGSGLERQRASKKSDADTIEALCRLTRYLAERTLADEGEPSAQSSSKKDSATQTVEVVDGRMAARGDMPLQDYLDAVERHEILSAIEVERHNKTAAARHLGVSFRSLRYRLDRLQIE